MDHEPIKYIFLAAFIMWSVIYLAFMSAAFAKELKKKEKFSIIRNKFVHSPLGVRVYIILSYFVVIIFISQFFLPDTINEKMIPIFGWGFNFIYPYAFGIYLPLLWVTKSIYKYPLAWYRKMIIFFCLFEIGICIFDWIRKRGENDFGNPHLMFSPYRWVLSCMIPLAFVFYFKRRKIIKYFAQVQKE